jgi:hypothetical protein
MLDASGTHQMLLAETLGLAMARRAWEILERHRAALAGTDTGTTGTGTTGTGTTGTGATGTGVGSSGAGGTAPEDDDAQFAADNAVFTAVLDAASESLARFDTRPADERWCDALLQVILLAQLASR